MEEDEETRDKNRKKSRSHDGDSVSSEKSRPTTPKWWRPSIPPETYLWEEMRRAKEKGGYPWTLLDREESLLDEGEYGDDDNSGYEPVNPTPVFEDENGAGIDEPRGKRLLDIPPDIELLTSEGLDGLDQPDPHEFGFDGDKEWHNFNSEDEVSAHSDRVPSSGSRLKKKKFPDPPPESETPEMEVDPLPEEETKPEDYEPIQSPKEEVVAQQGPSTLERRRTPQPEPTVVRVRVPSKFDVLKSKAGGAMGEMKRKLTETVTPRTLKRKPKGKKKVATEEEEATQGEPEGEGEPAAEPMEVDAEKPDELEKPEELKNGEAVEKKEEAAVVPEVTLTPEQEQAIKEQAELLAAQKAKEEEEKEKARLEELQRKEEERLEKERLKEEERLAKLKAKEEERLKKEEEKAKREKAKEEERIKKEKQKEEERKKKEEERIKKEKQKEEERKKKEEERIAKEKKKEEERIAKEKAKEEERLAKEKAKEEKLAKEKAKEEERLAKEKAKEDERLAKEKAKEEERIAREKEKEEERLAKEKADLEAAALAKEKAEQEEQEVKASEPVKQEETKASEPEQAVENKEVEKATVEESQEVVIQAEEGEPMVTEGVEEDREQHSRTPSLTRKGKKVKLEKRELPLPQLSLPKLQFERKVIKRSRTPPARPQTQPKKVAKKGSEDTVACDDEGKSMKGETNQAAEGESGEPMETEPSDEQAESEQGEREPEPRVVLKDPPTKETIDKIENKLNKIGQFSMNIAAQTTKGVAKGLGKTIKVIGKDLYKIGTVVNEKCQTTVEEIKAKQDAAKERARLKAEQEEEARLMNSGVYDEVSPPEESTEGQASSSQLADEPRQPYDTHLYENDMETKQDGDKSPAENQPEKLDRNQVLGRAERDWESPLDLARSRDGSEEPVSGLSSRDSPPPSSAASSSAPHGRRKGVLEEIDSDEFFLRERGISEGEDAEEVNRVLAEELRQTFRPQIPNALAGLDAEPPSRPDRTPRKPTRKPKQDESAPNFQTFPPERPKRKKVTGYVSSYMAEHGDDEMELMEDDSSNREDNDSMADEEDSEFESEGIRRVKEELSKIDRAMEEDEEEALMVSEGPYEQLVEEEPQKPTRSRKKAPKTSTPPNLYYNTIASHEWMRDIEGQILTEMDQDATMAAQPIRPPRESRMRPARDQMEPTQDVENKDREPSPFDEPINEDEIVQGHLRLVTVMDNLADLVDEGGYAIVQKDEPTTIPRKKRKDKDSQQSSSAQHEREEGEDRGPSFFSLPRFTPTVVQISPAPTRPHRNTYSTLSPRRPPRSKSKGNLPGSPPPEEQESEGPRPSSAIGIMQGRPLPPVPRSADYRTSPPLNDLDQASIEQALGLRQYVNINQMGEHLVEVQEPVCIPRNIPLLGRPFGDERQAVRTVSSENVGVQTDPMRMLEEEARNILSSFEVDNTRIDTSRDSANERPKDEHDTNEQDKKTNELRPRSRSPAATLGSTEPSRRSPSSTPQPAPMTFPTRLHLEELEVDFLRVNDLNAQSINVDRLQSPQLEVNSLTSLGPFSTPTLRTENLNTEQLNCERLFSENAEFPSIPPPSFYQLAAPPETQVDRESEQSAQARETRAQTCRQQEESGRRHENEEGQPITASMQLMLSETDSDVIIKPISTSTSSSANANQAVVTYPQGATAIVSDDDDIINLSVRLGRAVVRTGWQGLQAMADYIEAIVSDDPAKLEEQRANLKALLCILVIFVAGIILTTRSGASTNKWEFYMPPPDL